MSTSSSAGTAVDKVPQVPAQNEYNGELRKDFLGRWWLICFGLVCELRACELLTEGSCWVTRNYLLDGIHTVAKNG